ncbi:carboxyesterase [Mycena leptocephala]|nr:carboxyesterase [Mycena leptocephala]
MLPDILPSNSCSRSFLFLGLCYALVVVRSRAAAEPRGLVGTLTSKLGPVVNLGYAAYAGNATLLIKLPVYVYIHGGGHYYNSAQEFPRLVRFPANDWVARSGGGLIAIGLQYRVSAISLRSAIVNNPTSGPNNGLFDQRAGLEWIQRHIAAFGGDPTKGGGSPFRAAVIESPVGCDGASDIVACLRKASIGAIVSAVNNKPSTCKYEPVIDGGYIPTSPPSFSPLGNSRRSHSRWHNAQDGSIFSKATTDAMLVTYPPASNTTPWTTQWERAMYAYMETRSRKARFQLSLDAPDPNLLAARGAYVGAAHTAELFYLYDGTNSGPSASVAQPVFTLRADAGPNTFAIPGSPTWEPASKGGFMVPNLGNNVTAPSSAMARCAWWRSVGTDLRL